MFARVTWGGGEPLTDLVSASIDASREPLQTLRLGFLQANQFAPHGRQLLACLCGGEWVTVAVRVRTIRRRMTGFRAERRCMVRVLILGREKSVSDAASDMGRHCVISGVSQ